MGRKRKIVLKEKTEKLLVAKFGKTFGIKGYLIVHSFFTKKYDIMNFKNFFSEQNQEISLKLKKKGKNLIAKISEIDSPEQAKKFVGKSIFLEKKSLPKLKKNQFYYNDLIGIDVYIGARNVGKIKNVLNHGAGDYFEIVIKRTELLVPYNQQHILEVNIKKQRIQLNPSYYEI